MRLQTVTITGADDSADPEALVALSREFPFVEWAILVSAKRAGHGRFPSGLWLRRFARVAHQHRLKCSLHLCGQFVRDLLIGVTSFLSDDSVATMFLVCQRIQINTHGEPAAWDAPSMAKIFLSWLDRQVIQQVDGLHGLRIMEDVLADFANVVPLFDLSHGAGVLPGKWPRPEFHSNDVDFMLHGYAGGLGPENLAEQIPLIGAASEGAPFWIDMETKVRTDGRFDLAKVRRCLEIAAPFVERSA